MMGLNAIVDRLTPWNAQSHAGLSLIFRPGQRPSADDVLRLARLQQSTAQQSAAQESPAPHGAMPGFAISHRPTPADWLELLVAGMTFDLVGLSPAAPAPLPAMAHWLGLRETPGEAAEAITLMPGEALLGAEQLLPVVRIMAGVAARLAELADVVAVVWHPARTVLAPAVFIAAIDRWLQGGVFPALGLTALFSDNHDAICSEGLAFFIGHELRIEPGLCKNTAEAAKIATRLINYLVGLDPIDQKLAFTGSNGDQYSIEPSGNDRLLRVCRKS